VATSVAALMLPRSLARAGDVSACTAAEVALERSEARFQTVFDNAILGMAYLDRHGRVKECNPALATMLGCHPKDLVGGALLAIIGGNDDTPLLCSPLGDEYHVARPGALAEWVRVALSASGDDSLAMVEDISDRKMAEAQIRHIDRLAQLGELAASLAHEIGQPLNVIRLTAEGALDRLSAEVVDAGRQRRSLGVVLDQSRRLQEIIDHTLAYSRRADQAGQPLDPRSVIRSAVKLVVKRAQSHGVRLVWQPPRTAALVFGHAVRLEQVMVNLLTNACDAILAGHGGAQAKDWVGNIDILCRVDDEAGDVVVSVVDDGPGVPQSVMDRIFQPFFTTKPQGQGTGLGLSVSLGIIAQMGGRIEVTNLAPGARFDIRLPALESIGEEQGVAGRAGEAGRPHVILADDEPLAAAEIASFLCDHGYRVTTVAGGNAALAAYLLDRADVVVTDLHMPEGDGVALITRLKQEAPTLPIIALTVLAGDEPARARAAGAVMVLSKPLGLANIQAQIARMLAARDSLDPVS
jgi:signal transduction histidine kinase/ActR/RegA family two-component response regulator